MVKYGAEVCVLAGFLSCQYWLTMIEPAESTEVGVSLYFTTEKNCLILPIVKITCIFSDIQQVSSYYLIMHKFEVLTSLRNGSYHYKDDPIFVYFP